MAEGDEVYAPPATPLATDVEVGRKIGGLGTFVLLLGSCCIMFALPMSVTHLMEDFGRLMVCVAIGIALVGLGFVVRDFRRGRDQGLSRGAFVLLVLLAWVPIGMRMPSLVRKLQWPSSSNGAASGIDAFRAIHEAQAEFFVKNARYGSLEELVAGRHLWSFSEPGAGGEVRRGFYTVECVAFEDRWMAIANSGPPLQGTPCVMTNHTGQLWLRPRPDSPPFVLNDTCEPPKDARRLDMNLGELPHSPALSSQTSPVGSQSEGANR